MLSFSLFSGYIAPINYTLQNSCIFSKDGVTDGVKSEVTTNPTPFSKVY